MKFYLGYKTNKYVYQTKQTILKGSFKYKGREPYFTEMKITGYVWNPSSQKWLSEEEFQKYEWAEFCCTIKGINVPRSYKAFKRHIRNLQKICNFPKGTIIQLSGRISGVGIFCII